MKNKLPVYIENNDLPIDSYFIKEKRKDSYGYVNFLYLASIIITVCSVMIIIFVGK